MSAPKSLLETLPRSVQFLLATAVVGLALWWARGATDWVALRAQPWQRAGLLAAVLAGNALLYFGTLRAAGVRAAQFMRR